MASLTTENALRQQVNALGQSLGFADMSTKSFTAADLRLLLIDSLQKLDALSPSSANDEGETKTSNGLNSGGPQPQTKEELRTWLEEYCKDMKNHGEPNTWDVTLVMDMSKLFQKMKTFNEPIYQWNTSMVTNMNSMFEKAKSFNQPLNRWDTSSVVDMNSMFKKAKSFNQPLNGWDTSSVVDMGKMFRDADGFNQLLSTWNTSSVTEMKQMFEGASALDDVNKPSFAEL